MWFGSVGALFLFSEPLHLALGAQLAVCRDGRLAALARMSTTTRESVTSGWRVLRADTVACLVLVRVNVVGLADVGAQSSESSSALVAQDAEPVDVHDAELAVTAQVALCHFICRWESSASVESLLVSRAQLTSRFGLIRAADGDTTHECESRAAVCRVP